MRVLLIADLHIGNIPDTNYIYTNVCNILDKELIFNHCDAVIFLGDYFDRLFKANEIFISLAIDIMSYLVTLCKKTHTKIRMIYGTESHDSSQYKLFNHHLKDDMIDMKIIYTVTEEELFPSINVLYIPEEYMMNKKEHYKEYLYSGKSYQYIFGHGVIAEGMTMIHIPKEGTKQVEKKVPIFKSNELSSVADQVIWGHYHCHVEMEKNCRYLGSLFRNSFGEEGDKGYGILEDEHFTFVKNEYAYLYKTYEFMEDDEIFKNADKLIHAINRIKHQHADIISGDKPGKIRFIFNIISDELSLKEVIKNCLMNSKHIAYVIKDQSLTNEILDDVEDEYDYTLDKSLKIEDKVGLFIEGSEPQISSTELYSILYEELSV